MKEHVVILIVIALAIVALGILAVALARKKKLEPDYRTYFIIGITWIPFGIVLMTSGNSPTFFILGLVFMAIGLANKDKWKKPPPLIDSRKPVLLLLLLAGTLILVALTGLFVYKKWVAMHGSLEIGALDRVHHGDDYKPSSPLSPNLLLTAQGNNHDLLHINVVGRKLTLGVDE